MKKFFKGFQYAFEGVWYALKTQVNMRFHAVATFLVLMASCYFPITQTEFFFVLLGITLVWASELFNTAVESLTDLVSPEKHPLAKIAKDCAAGAVLVCSIFASIIGVLIFGKYFFV